MLVVMLIVVVLIGVAYADFCLVSNTAHFGICYGKVAEAEKRRDSRPPATSSRTRMAPSGPRAGAGTA